MRNYEGMRLPPTLDPHVRNELLKADKWLKQASIAFAKTIASGNYPTVVVRQGGGGGGVITNMPDHTHARAGEGGSVLGDPYSLINVYGVLEIDGDALYIKDPAGGSRVLVAAPALSADVLHTLAAHDVTWPTALPGVLSSMLMDTAGVISYGSPSADEVEQIGIYGNGPDGSPVLDGATSYSGLSRSGNNYFLTRDFYMNNLTIDSGKTLDTAGYRLFGMGTLLNNGTLYADGAPGLVGANAAGSGTPVGGAGGAQASAITAGNNTAGTSGRNGGTGVGSGTASAPGAGAGEGGSGGGGGNGEPGGFGAAGGVGQAGTAQVVHRHRSTGSLLFLQDYALGYQLVQGGTGGRGGASGAGDGTSRGAAGGGGGAGGRVCPVWFRNITNNGTIQARGGNGGPGGNSDALGGGAGGGGGGGGGGFLWLYYDVLINTGTIAAAGGTGGAPGTMGGFGTATAGGNGSPGTVVKYCRLDGLFT